MKLLNIIVAVSRNHKNLERTLDSIDKIKLDKDISVIVLSNEINLKKDLLKRFKFESKVLQSKKNYGPLYQEALDNCKGQYVTFIDADDMFDTNGTRQVIDFLKNNDLNVLRTDLAESYIGLDGKPAIGIVNYTFVETPHAHFFKLDYLKDKNIKFNEKLDVYALDNFYRNAIFNTEVKGLKLTTYLSGFTAVQYDKNHLPINVENIDEYYDSIIDTFETLQKNKNEYYKVYLLTVIFSLYLIVESADFNIPTLQDKKRKYERIIYTIHSDYLDIFNFYDDNVKNNILSIEFEKQRRTNINFRLLLPFSDFIALRSNVINVDKNVKNNFLDIIIPEYDGEEFIFDLLDSIVKQKNINFDEIGVIIVNDASPKKIKKYKFNRYGNLNINYIFNEKNVGQGLTRQHGIDNSNATYVTFFDQDDIVYDKDAYCLSKVISFLKTEKPDGMVAGIIEEIPTFNGIYEDEQKLDKRGVYLHGIFYNREYINSIGLRFCPKLRQLEDTYFNSCFFAKAKKVSTIDVIVYRWRNNIKSQVRVKNPVIFELRSFDSYSLCFQEVCSFLKEDEFEEMRIDKILNALLAISNLVNSNYALVEELDDVREKIRLEAYSIILKYKSVLDNASEEKYEEMNKKALLGMTRHYPDFKANCSIYEFMAEMKDKYPDL